MKKLICFDYDNTITRDGKILPGTREKILSLKEKGYIIALDSGRGVDDCRCAAEEVGVSFDYYLACDGTYVTDRNLTRITDLHSTMGAFSGCTEILLKHNPSCIRRAYENSGFQLESENPDEAHGTVLSREEFDSPDAPIFIIACDFDTEKDASDAISELRDKFGSGPEIFNYGKSIDIMPHGAGKDYGIYKVMELEGIDADNVYTIGDTDPDVPMISKPFHGFLIETAPPSIHKYAERIVKSVSEFIDLIPE